MTVGIGEWLAILNDAVEVAVEVVVVVEVAVEVGGEEGSEPFEAVEVAADL